MKPIRDGTEPYQTQNQHYTNTKIGFKSKVFWFKR